MDLIDKMCALFRNLVHKPRRDTDEAAEVQAYIDLLVDEFVDAGMPRSEAERQARIRYGGTTQLEQAVRDVRTGIQVVLLWQGVRLAIRQFLREPLFTAAAVASLALGMGATTAIFSAVYSLTIRPLPFEHAGQLISLSQSLRSGKGNAMFAPDFQALRASPLRSFQFVSGFVERGDLNLNGGYAPERLHCIGITANLLTTLGVNVELGRDFLDTDDRSGTSRVVLLSDRVWRTHFGGNRDLIGRPITLDGEPRTVIGVLPPGFVFPDPSIEPDVFVPAVLPTSTIFDGGPVAPVMVIGRLRQRVTHAQAEAEVKAFFAARAQFYPSGWSKPTLVFESLQEHVSGDSRKPLVLLLACVFCVLMVTCANVGNLQLARAASRIHEFSIRQALGASRVRLIQQFLTETLVLNFTASLVGLALAWISLVALQRFGFLTGTPVETAYGEPAFTGLFGKYGNTVHISLPVLLVTFTLPLFTTGFFGIIPALRATRSASGNLKSEATQITAGHARRRLGHVLLAVEIAAAITLVSCAGLLIRSLTNLMSYESGFDSRNVMTAELRLTGSRYQTSEDLNRFSSAILDRLEAVPGANGVALTNVLPVENTAKIRFSFTGEPNPPFDPGHLVAFITISPQYFNVMGTPLLRGRQFNAGDATASPRVLIVNRNLATRFFGGNAIGKRLYLQDLGSRSPHFVAAEIVGVAENVPHNGLLQPLEPEVYLPLAQVPQPDMEIAIRSTGNPVLLVSPLLKAVADTDPTIPVTGIQTMDERIAYRVMFRKAIMLLVSSFAVLAMMVSAIGVGGMFAYMVVQRTREMGIRLALGASRTHVLRIVVGEAWSILNVGILLGLLASFAFSRLIASMLVGVGKHDPVVNVSALALMTVVALSAAILPAIRASRTNVLAVLRDE